MSLRSVVRRLQRRISSRSADWLIAHPRTLANTKLRDLTNALCNDDRDRQVVVNELKELVKKSSPPVEAVRIDARPGRYIGFEHLTGLFASNALNEYISTMNFRQSAYLFDLIRRSRAKKVIEIGRHWGGTTVLIAAALDGEGSFWSVADPHETDWDVALRGRLRPRPIADQLESLLSDLGLPVHLISGNTLTVEVETGEVDIVHLDGAFSYQDSMGEFERYGLRVKVGGSVQLDDAIEDEFCDSPHKADVKRVAADIAARDDFKVVATIDRLLHLQRLA